MNKQPSKFKRNLEIVNLINGGLSYRTIAKLIGLSLSRIESINKKYNNNDFKKERTYCVRCGSQRNLELNSVRNICNKCLHILKSL